MVSPRVRTESELRQQPLYSHWQFFSYFQSRDLVPTAGSSFETCRSGSISRIQVLKDQYQILETLKLSQFPSFCYWGHPQNVWLSHCLWQPNLEWSVSRNERFREQISQSFYCSKVCVCLEVAVQWDLNTIKVRRYFTSDTCFCWTTFPTFPNTCECRIWVNSI